MLVSLNSLVNWLIAWKYRSPIQQTRKITQNNEDVTGERSSSSSYSFEIGTW